MLDTMQATKTTAQCCGVFYVPWQLSAVLAALTGGLSRRFAPHNGSKYNTWPRPTHCFALRFPPSRVSRTPGYGGALAPLVQVTPHVER